MGFDWENDDSDLLNHEAVDKLVTMGTSRILDLGTDCVRASAQMIL